jgi:DNA replication protein DnaC
VTKFFKHTVPGEGVINPNLPSNEFKIGDGPEPRKKKATSATAKASESTPSGQVEETLDDLTDMRNWPLDEDRNGLSGERLRNCILYCLDYADNEFLNGLDITKGSMESPKFISLIDSRTPPGWTPEKHEKKSKRGRLKKIKPLDFQLAQWLMNGPGPNAPLAGWESWEDKRDAIKTYWYGPGGVGQPDPEKVDFKALFNPAKPVVEVVAPAKGGVVDPEPVGSILAKAAAWLKQPYQIRWPKQCAVRNWVVVLTRRRMARESWTHEDIDLVARGEKTCPVCSGAGNYGIVKRGVLNKIDGSEPDVIYVNEVEWCECGEFKQVRKVIDSKPSQYDFVNLWTLQPHQFSILPQEVQAEELTYIRANHTGSFLFHGPAGTGKTTFSQALYFDAMYRSGPRFWKEGHAVKLETTEWIWYKNFATLLQEHNEHQWNREAPEPTVTPSKIAAVRELKYTPTLVLEEVDKQELNPHRISFLFGLIDETLKAKGGQVVLTTNLTPMEFEDYLTSNKEISSTGIAIIRRLTQTVHVRNHFR